MGSILGFFESVLDVVVPLRPRAARTKRRRIEEFPLVPTPHELLGSTITTLMDYREGAVQDMIRALKYDKSAHAAKLCATVLADYLQEEISQQKIFSPRKIFIVPIPLHASRARERGFNQIGLVLEHLPPEFRQLVAPQLLVRNRATKPQTRLQRSERLSNVAGAFEVPTPAEVRGTHIYLIDDVTTTGATLVNAATPLKRAGATVSLLALARA